MEKKVKFYQNPVHIKEGDHVKYYLIITEYSLIENKVLSCYAVEMPLWTRWHRFEEYDYYHPMQN
jgi:hypothetical protein